MLSFFLFIISPFLSVPVLVERSLKRDRMAFFLLLCLISLICFLLIPNFDHDKARYFERYELFKSMGYREFGEYLLSFANDHVFAFLIFIFSKWQIPIEFLFFFMSLISLSLISTVLNKIIKNSDNGVFISFFLLFFFSISLPSLFSGVRFLFGLSFLYYGWYILVLEGKKMRSFLFIFIATQTHFGLLYFVPFIVLQLLDRRMKVPYFSVFLGSFLFLLISPVQIMNAFTSIGVLGSYHSKIETYVLGEDYISAISEKKFSNYMVYLINIAWYFPGILYLIYRRRAVKSSKNSVNIILYNSSLLFFAANNLFFILPTVFSRYSQFTKYVFLIYIIYDLSLNYRQIKINRWVKIFIVIFGINLLVNINAFRFNLRKSLFKIENLSMYYLLKQRVTTEEML